MRRAAVAVVFLLAGVVSARAQEIEQKPPKDSVQLVITGCLDKRVIDATRIEPPDVETDVHDFQLSGKKDIMAEVKSRNKERVTVTGWVRKVDLAEPGLRLGNSNVRIGPAASSDPMRPQVPEQTRRIVTMEVLSVEPAPGHCGK